MSLLAERKGVRVQTASIKGKKKSLKKKQKKAE